MSKTNSTLAHSIHDLIGTVNLVPDITEIGHGDDQQRLIVAFINEEVLPESRGELHNFDALQARDTDRIAAALNDTLRETFREFESRHSTMTWVREEVAYRLGVEVGRRLR